MKRAREAPRRSFRLRHLEEGRAGISRLEAWPREMFMEVASHLELIEHLSLLANLALTCSAFARVVAVRLELPQWLREFCSYDDASTAYGINVRLRTTRKIYIGLYYGLGNLMKWPREKPMTQSLWNRFSYHFTRTLTTNEVYFYLRDKCTYRSRVKIYVSRNDYLVEIAVEALQWTFKFDLAKNYRVLRSGRQEPQANELDAFWEKIDTA